MVHTLVVILQLYWRDVSSSGRPKYFTKILPKQAVAITSRTVHEWTARDNQGRSMIIGNGTRMVPVANTETTKSIFFIKNQGWLKLNRVRNVSLV